MYVASNNYSELKFTNIVTCTEITVRNGLKLKPCQSLYYALCILRMSNVDGRVTGEMWVGNYLEKKGRDLFNVFSRNLPGNERNISLYTSNATQIQTRHFSITIPKFYNYECKTESTSINLHKTSPIRQNYSTPKPQFKVKISPHTSVKLV